MSQRSTGSTVAKVLITILVLVVLLIILAEVGLRMFMSNQITSSIEEQSQQDQVELTEEPEVSFGTAPLVFGLFAGQLNEVNVRTPSTLEITEQAVSGQPATDLHMQGMDLSEEMVSDRVTVTTELPEDYLLAVMREQLVRQQPEDAGPLADHLTVTDVTANGADNTIDLEFVHGAAVISLTPVEQDGQVSFAADGTQIFGFDLPEQATDQITEAFAEGVNAQTNEEANVRIADIQILDGALRITLDGENVPLGELARQAEQSGELGRV
ncbi:DUF2993 domain-containing protein [Corynebacterium yudongzhengii]|uniref:DUF2993 domain-containing protein n=1 Tax=Corynebacterium yudongzhengii TaxID=2080740 RepID=A0A2U1T9L2_9CORY|nr:DUF2993 domain-containing protein [Corynebacterium yudongzhengii]AWB81140.1 DUF2993 domain-containing protein [Corynebacterium yudongzhengii]PWC02679.1 DUF2993 domain-containing protein [Corynebacterium yudongzhengii]